MTSNEASRGHAQFKANRESSRCATVALSVQTFELGQLVAHREFSTEFSVDQTVFDKMSKTPSKSRASAAVQELSGGATEKVLKNIADLYDIGLTSGPGGMGLKVSVTPHCLNT